MRSLTAPSRSPRDSAAVKQSGHWGYADTTGKLAINPQFDDAHVIYQRPGVGQNRREIRLRGCHR